MAGSHLTDKQYAEIGAKFTAYVTDRGKASVETSEWRAVLGDDLFEAALDGGYFGPPGTVPGLDYGDGKQEGAQVRVTQPDDGSPSYAELFVNGEVVAKENVTNPGGFDSVAFAKKHGVDI